MSAPDWPRLVINRSYGSVEIFLKYFVCFTYISMYSQMLINISIRIKNVNDPL